MLYLRPAKLLCALAAVVALSLSAPQRVAARGGGDEGIRADLPENGVLVVENPRGNISIEVWSERYVSVATVVRGEKPKGAPVLVQRLEEALAISVPPRQIGMLTRVDLTLRIPERARARVAASTGEIKIQGVPAELSVRNLSGNIRSDFSSSTDADIEADAPAGKVSYDLTALGQQTGLPPNNGR